MDFSPELHSWRLSKVVLEAFPDWQVYLSIDGENLRVAIVSKEERIVPASAAAIPEVAWLSM